MVRAGKTLLLASVLMTSLHTGAAMAADSGEAGLRSPLPSGVSPQAISPEKVKRDSRIAYSLARYEYFDKVAEADPRIVAAVCAHPGPAKIVAKHRHLDKIAEADKYVCRRLTQWEGATQKLIRNPYFDKVVEKDPEGLAFALDRKPEYARVIARQQAYWSLSSESRNWNTQVIKHIK